MAEFLPLPPPNPPTFSDFFKQFLEDSIKFQFFAVSEVRMPHSQFGICEEKLAMMMTGPGNTDEATATAVAAIHLRIRVRSHFWSARASKDCLNGSKAELLANIKIIEDAMFPDDALKAATLQIVGRRRIIEACTLEEITQESSQKWRR
ncbi:uncharacterized protein LOC109706479 isoform X2 [Ananas comosus]|uniref:Uncharacterized protein LOC109706479 isoform X2 n=1 Tax=Ananas comosus TaxID=4615 RepID=A0A6P5ENN3_ANACO|nr:uncharacterized protein LOC109706479 isoform X2 [Ananas comosus]